MRRMPSPVRPWRLAAVVLAFAPALLSCKTPPPACPESDVCVLLEQAMPLQQTRETYLACPIYLGWNREGAGLALAPGLPLRGEAKVDKEATRKRRADVGDEGTPNVCCYHWYAKCPTPAPSGG
jgi:hypothetical protein